jgi:hypothetical protein
MFGCPALARQRRVGARARLASRILARSPASPLRLPVAIRPRRRAAPRRPHLLRPPFLPIPMLNLQYTPDMQRIAIFALSPLPLRVGYDPINPHGQHRNRTIHPVTQYRNGVFTLLSRLVQYGLISRYSMRFDPSTILAKNSRSSVVVIVSMRQPFVGIRLAATRCAALVDQTSEVLGDKPCRDLLQNWGYEATRRHAIERLVGAQRHAAASAKSNGPRGTLESWVPFPEQLVESLIEDGATNLQ